MYPNEGTAEHDNVDHDLEHELIASLVMNCLDEIDKCNNVNSEVQRSNNLLTRELKRYKVNEKHLQINLERKK